MSAGEAPAVDCAVWWGTARCDPRLMRVLDDHEREQAARLRRPEDRDRYVTAHALVRFLLADCTGMAAHVLRFDRTCRRCGEPHGKPRLADGGKVRFNLTHADARVGVAIATDAEVGIDMERKDGIDEEWLDALVPEMLSAQEYAEYLALSPSERPHAVAVWWTRKEAVLKATGEGLVTPLASLTVTPPFSSAGVRMWSGPRASSGAQPSMCLRDASPPGSYVGAVAVVGTYSVSVTERDADPLLSRCLGEVDETRILSAFHTRTKA